MVRAGPPPPTRTDDAVEVLHGISVADPYRWLEDEASPEVQAWTEARGEHARAVLTAVPGRDRIAARLRELLAIGTISPPSVHRGRYFYLKRTGEQEQPVLYLREGARGADGLLLDPAAGNDTTRALDWCYPSPDGRLLAYGLSEGGSEQSTLRALDVDSGREIDGPIPWTRACSLEWLPDASAFFYTRYPEPGTVPSGEESYHRRVFLHVLGRDWRDDALVFPEPGRVREPEDWPSVHLSPDGRWLVIGVSRGWTRTDMYLRDLARGGPFTTVVEGVEALHAPIVRNDIVYMVTNDGAPRSRLVAFDPERPARPGWREVIPEAEDVLESAAAVGRTILVLRLREASSRLFLHEADGRLVREVALPGLGSVSAITGEWDGDEAFFGFSSYTTPPLVARVSLPAGETETWERVPAELDPEAFHVSLARCRSADGTPVSLFLVHRKDRPADGHGPGLLTGYGGFNVSLTPAFARGLVLFLEAGGLYAVAHLRGGGEYGEEWHRAGMLSRKQNAFDDFIAAAELLKAQRLVAPERLAIMGGSNGGLLVGAVLTQRPDLARAVVCQVPLLDMLRYHRFRIARLWIPEYGSPEDPEAFAWLHAYSPYHRVRDGVAYPAVLLTTGESDSRVDPLHARKMAARLQAATSSGRPVLLRVETRAGHGQGKPLSKVVEEWTDVWSFVFGELGLEP